MNADLRRIIHVEDEADIRQLVELSLGTVGGYEVISFARGQEALEKSPGMHPDLFILDVMMPGIDGEETLLRLRQLAEFRYTPIIFMTAKASKEDQEHLKSLGAVDVIPKPFDPMNLPAQVRSIWGRAQASI